MKNFVISLIVEMLNAIVDTLNALECCVASPVEKIKY
jgi:hypothetical protein